MAGNTTYHNINLDEPGNFDAPLHNYGVPISRFFNPNPIYAVIEDNEHQIPAKKIMILFDEKIRETISHKYRKLMDDLEKTLQDFREKLEAELKEKNKTNSKRILKNLLTELGKIKVIPKTEFSEFKSESAKIIDDYFKN